MMKERVSERNHLTVQFVRRSRVIGKHSFRNSFEDEMIAASLMETFAHHYGLSKILENQIKFGSFAESSQKFRHLQEYLNILRETTNYFIHNSSNSHLTMAQRVESSNLPKDRFYGILRSGVPWNVPGWHFCTPKFSF